MQDIWGASIFFFTLPQKLADQDLHWHAVCAMSHELVGCESDLYLLAKDSK